MNKVYIIFRDSEEIETQDEIIGVFLSKDKANKYISEYNKGIELAQTARRIKYQINTTSPKNISEIRKLYAEIENLYKNASPSEIEKIEIGVNKLHLNLEMYYIHEEEILG